MEIPGELYKLLGEATTSDALGISPAIISDLIYRVLFNEGEVSLLRFSEVIRVHTGVLDQMLAHMQREHLIEIAKADALGRLSYTYRLTEEGNRRVRDSLERGQYLGPAPVSLDIYNRAVLMQTRKKQHVTPQQVTQALRHLILPPDFHRRIGPAINESTSLFLYGPPGNGKTTVAQAIARMLASSDPIWLPYALTVGGQIIQLFDPMVHIAVETEEQEDEQKTGPLSGKAQAGPRVDKRWGLFQRPAVMAGGELAMESLELRFEPVTKFYEAPLQMKANGGMFLIDDFGRQQVSPQQLLNRWIVPLESGFDFLRLRSGQTLRIPFRQLIVFSTNLDPMDLVDDAFLRRIQMKVIVDSPDERRFYQIFVRMCQALEIPFEKEGFVYLLQKWYQEPKRALQAVHPRDILKTLKSICAYEGRTPRLTPELLDEACNSYFVS